MKQKTIKQLNRVDPATLEQVSQVVLKILLLLKKNSQNEELCKWGRSSLSHACRHVEYFLTTRVSVAAHKKALSMKVAPLEQYCWKDQPKAMKDPNRKIFHLEHIEPVSQLREELLQLKSPTLGAVQIILEKVDIAWILKEEDNCLNKKGFRSKRENGGLAAYAVAGIKLRPCILK